MSAPCWMAAKRRSASSMGAERSASVKSTTAAPRLEHPGAHAVALAAVAGVFNEPDLGRGLGKGAHHLGGRVGGAVVDHQDLGIPAAGANAAHHRPQRRQDAGALVVNRNHEAVLWPGAFAGVALGIVFHVSAPSLKLQPIPGAESSGNATGHHKRRGANLAGQDSGAGISGKLLRGKAQIHRGACFSRQNG
jgi:hypothetical protein